MKESTTRRLMARAQGGDRDALEELFVRAYPSLLQAARMRMGPVLRSRMDTTDLAQSAYFEAYKDLRRYEYRGKGSFLRWLLRILENKIRRQLDFLRAQKRDVRRDVTLAPGDEGPVRGEGTRPPPPFRGEPPVERLIANEDRERLERAMDQLDDHYRSVLVYRYYLAMGWREIGAELGRSEEAAQMLCRRALRKLRELYGE